MTQLIVEELVEEITRYLNSTLPKERSFIAAMNSQHRTLQQSFTKLCLKWLEYVASEDYRYDDRNKASHEIAKELVNTFRQFHENMRNKPSDYLPLI